MPTGQSQRKACHPCVVRNLLLVEWSLIGGGDAAGMRGGLRGWASRRCNRHGGATRARLRFGQTR